MPPTVPWVRPLYPPSSPRKTEGGDDVVAHKRALARVGAWPWRPFDDEYNEVFSEAVKRWQKEKGIQATGFWGRPTQNALAQTKTAAGVENPGFAYDATAIKLLEREQEHRSKTDEQKKAEALLVYCKQFDDGYCYGGEHDGSTLDDDPHDCYDCSSSTSSALAKVGLLGDTEAHVSGWFKTWGAPGPGRFVTVYAANDHVWMAFTIPGQPWCRFDTSPHGDGPTGARVRKKMRDTSRFVVRHPVGL